jgi:hypothetical protein
VPFPENVERAKRDLIRARTARGRPADRSQDSQNSKGRVIDLPKNKTAGFKAVGFHQLRAMGCCAFGAPAENRPIPNVWSFAADGRSSAERDRFRTLHFQRSLRLEARVSFQITILKVLAGHPEGRASLADLRRAVGILISRQLPTQEAAGATLNVDDLGPIPSCAGDSGTPTPAGILVMTLH